MIRTRFAPTPSGYLHVGNAWSFVLSWLCARSLGGKIHLRIDDMDAARFREEYLQDIFAALEWLGLDYDSGPRDPADFRARYSQRLRTDAYRSALDTLMSRRTPEGPLVYACVCSRKQVRAASRETEPSGIYPGTCRTAIWDRSGKDCVLRLRLRTDAGLELGVEDALAGTLRLNPGRDLGDFVLRQRNGDVAYQLASVSDDEALGIDYVVRGADLLPSTGAQRLLAEHLGLVGFSRARFLHHGLMVNPDGTKLSKSAGDVSLASLRGKWEAPDALYRYFARCLGMEPAGKRRVSDLLPEFDVRRVPMGAIVLGGL